MEGSFVKRVSLNLYQCMGFHLWVLRRNYPIRGQRRDINKRWISMERSLWGNEWVLTFTSGRDSPGRRLAPLQGHSTRQHQSNHCHPSNQEFGNTDESMQGLRKPYGKAFIFLRHPAKATGPLVRMRVNLYIVHTRWKNIGHCEVSLGHNLNEQLGRIWMSVVGVEKVKDVEFPRKRRRDRCHNHSDRGHCVQFPEP